LRGLPVVLILVVPACSREPSFQELLGTSYRELQRGDLVVALAHAEEGEGRARAARDPAWEWRFGVLHAEALVEQRRNADALARLEAAARPEGPTEAADVRALMTRARVRCRAGGAAPNFRQAEADLAEAGRLAESLRASELLAELGRHRGTCALLQGDYPSAEKHFREALLAARRERQPLMEEKAAGSIGLVKMRTRRYDDAASWFSKALDLARASKVELDEIKTLTNLGWCYYQLGDFDRALGFLTRGEELAGARGFTGERLLALQNVGNVHYRLGELGRADEAYRKALAIAREQAEKGRTAELLSNLGSVAVERGHYDEAEGFVREALRIKDEIQDLKARQHSLLAEGQIREGRADYGRAEALYREVIGSPQAERELLWEARASLASLRVKTHRPAEAEGEFRAALAIMEESRSELRQADHKISFFSSLDRFYDAYVDFLVASGRVREPLEVADRSRARLLRERLGTEAVAAQRFQEAARAKDAVILFYRLAPGRSFLWTVSARAIELHVLPPEAEIREHVEAHQALVLRSRDPLAEGAPDARWLYRTLVGPAKSALSAGARVVVIPDGALYQVNLETLVVPDPPERYWIEDVTLSTAPSLALLTAGSSSPLARRARGVLIIGDPVSPNPEFPPLAHAAREIEGIAAQFEPSERTVLTGARAEPSAYKAADAGGFSFIHFAAHAQAVPEIPLDSAVILSAREDVYRLYARDILETPLQARLVTLSACRSAGSRTFAGEGPVGLAWAFLKAGAGNVVAGLWNVEDASTSELMEALYRELAKGVAPTAALRGAKLGHLHSGTAYRKPFYWAPFLIYTQAADQR
jgi:CHAT domain-containing protein/Tfp pilus assembly protein PilF